MKMLPAPLHPFFPFARALATPIGLFLLFSSLVPAHAADSTLKLMIPPGHTELDDLQKDYEKSSKELQAGFEAVQKNAPACPHGAGLSKIVAKGSPWQKAQRERILGALNQSTAELQGQIAQLDQTAAESETPGGAGTVASAKTVIADRIDKPRAVIQKELPSVQAFTFRVQKTVDAASQILAGDAPDCGKARDAYFRKVKPQAEALADKLKKLASALDAHKTALDAYADSVSASLNRPKGRVPASKY